MTNLPHNARRFRCRSNTPDLTLRRHPSRHAILIRFEDRRLVQTYGRSMYAHIKEHNIRIIESGRQSQVIREGERRGEEDVVHMAMSPPEVTIQIVFRIARRRSMEVREVAAK